MNQERGLYRVVAFTSDSKAEAARTRDVVKNLRKNLGLQCTNKAQGLGEVLISVKGIK